MESVRMPKASLFCWVYILDFVRLTIFCRISLFHMRLPSALKDARGAIGSIILGEMCGSSPLLSMRRMVVLLSSPAWQGLFFQIFAMWPAIWSGFEREYFPSPTL